MAEMETMFRDKFSENIRVRAIFSHQAHIGKGAIRILIRHSEIVTFIFLGGHLVGCNH
jgi:hypothetical protein